MREAGRRCRVFYEIQPWLPTPGEQGWVSDSFAHPLPTGLPDRSSVICGPMVSPGYWQVTDLKGIVWEVSMTNIEIRHRYRIPGHSGWLREQDPRVLAFLGSYIGWLKRQQPTSASTADWQIGHLSWVIERSGPAAGPVQGACRPGAE